MKKFFLLSLLVLVNSCQSNKDTKTQKNKGLEIAPFFIETKVGSYNNFKAYLHRFSIDSNLYISDSTIIIKNNFIFKGKRKYHERCFISFERSDRVIPIVIDSDSIQISVDFKNTLPPTIKGSPLSDELESIRKQSEAIHKKISYLLPFFHKARLENDSLTISSIRNKIIVIEKENDRFIIDYINQNKDNIISVFLLHDFIKRDTLHKEKWQIWFNKFPIKNQESIEGKSIQKLLKSPIIQN